jgi:hypothetical protein
MQRAAGKLHSRIKGCCSSANNAVGRVSECHRQIVAPVPLTFVQCSNRGGSLRAYIYMFARPAQTHVEAAAWVLDCCCANCVQMRQSETKTCCSSPDSCNSFPMRLGSTKVDNLMFAMYRDQIEAVQH